MRILLLSCFVVTMSCSASRGRRFFLPIVAPVAQPAQPDVPVLQLPPENIGAVVSCPLPAPLPGPGRGRFAVIQQG
jgi:hypothetical protein